MNFPTTTALLMYLSPDPFLEVHLERLVFAIFIKPGLSTPGFCIVFLCLNFDSDLRNLGVFLNPDLRFLIIRLQDYIYTSTAIYVAQECSFA